MDLQKRLLRAMLAMLALAAVAGIVAIFLSPAVMGRVAGTALVASISIAIAMPVSRLLDSDKGRKGGLIGLTGIVVSFVLFLGAIWLEPILPGTDTEWRLAGTGVIFLLGCLAGARLLPHVRDPGLGAGSRLFLITDLGACLWFLLAVWTGSFDLQEKLWTTGWHIAGAGFGASLSLAGFGQRWRHWQWLGVLGAFAQVVIALLGVWYIPSNDPSLFIAVAGVTAVIAHANIVTRVPMGESGVWAQWTAIGGLASTAACVTVLSFITAGFDRPGPDLLTRIAGACGIVGACGSMACLVMYRLHRRPPGVLDKAGTIAGVQVTCPSCAKRQLIPIGESACASCGLLISVLVREPHCPQCDYMLLGIKGAVCPECGAPIPGRDRQPTS